VDDFGGQVYLVGSADSKAAVVLASDAFGMATAFPISLVHIEKRDGY
jgi:hypothetical protein